MSPIFEFIFAFLMCTQNTFWCLSPVIVGTNKNAQSNDICSEVDVLQFKWKEWWKKIAVPDMVLVPKWQRRRFFLETSILLLPFILFQLCKEKSSGEIEIYLSLNGAFILKDKKNDTFDRCRSASVILVSASGVHLTERSKVIFRGKKCDILKMLSCQVMGEWILEVIDTTAVFDQF